MPNPYQTQSQTPESGSGNSYVDSIAKGLIIKYLKDKVKLLFQNTPPVSEYGLPPLNDLTGPEIGIEPIAASAPSDISLSGLPSATGDALMAGEGATIGTGEVAGEMAPTMGLGAWGAAAAPLIMTAYALATNPLGSGRNYPKENAYETVKGLEDFTKMAKDPNHTPSTWGWKSSLDESPTSLVDLYAMMHNLTGGKDKGVSSGFTDSQIDRTIMGSTGLDIGGLRTMLGISDLPDLSQGGDLKDFAQKRMEQGQQLSGNSWSLPANYDFWTGKIKEPLPDANKNNNFFSQNFIGG
jgi:hypothetical protein